MFFNARDPETLDSAARLVVCQVARYAVREICRSATRLRNPWPKRGFALVQSRILSRVQTLLRTGSGWRFCKTDSSAGPLTPCRP